MREENNYDVAVISACGRVGLPLSIAFADAVAKVKVINGNSWRVGEPSVLAANPALHANLKRFLQE